MEVIEQTITGKAKDKDAKRSAACCLPSPEDDEMQNMRLGKVKEILRCPRCRGRLMWKTEGAFCTQCMVSFPVQAGIPNFRENELEKSKDADFQAEQMFGSTVTAKIFNAGKKLVNSEYTPKDQLHHFLREMNENAFGVELGSGNRRLTENVINIDIFGFPNVDIIADAASVPFADATVDFVIIDTVLEHVPEPHRIVNEIYRILKPGGKVLCITPFIFPYHGYPKHYFNFSTDGLDFLFKEFSVCRVEMHIGPTSALTNLLSEYVAVALSGESKFFYTFWKGVALLPIFLLKYLDLLWSPGGRGMRISSCLCALARK